jgi:hypothetical protein
MVYLPGPEAGHDPLLEGLRLDPALNLHVGGVHVAKYLRQLCLHTSRLYYTELRRKGENEF